MVTKTEQMYHSVKRIDKYEKLIRKEYQLLEKIIGGN